MREAENAEFADPGSAVKKALGDKVEKVIISNRITDSPCVLVTGQFGRRTWLVLITSHSFVLMNLFYSIKIGTYHEGPGAP